jgi:uncharacterized protein
MFKKVILSWLLALVPLLASPNFPELSGRVVDEAQMLTADQRAELTHRLQTHEHNSSNQIVVVTLVSLEGYDIADYGYQLGRHWQIGQQGKDNGVLLIVAKSERKVRIEVGYGLEGSLTDAIAHQIIQNDITPHFKKGDFYRGIHNAVDRIIATINGEYQTQKTKKSDNEGALDTLLSLLFMGFFLFTVTPKKLLADRALNRYLNAGLSGSIIGVIGWFMTHELWIALTFVAIFAFLAYVVNGKMKHLHNSRGDGYYSGSSYGGGFGGLGSGGGFSGGGGGFGGGGASGSW